MKLAIHQPNFLPWIGFFHKVAQCDTFVLLDDVQFERGKTYTSRTEVLIGGSRNWLTVPIVGRSEMNLIKDVLVDTSFDWRKKHLRTLELNYGRAKHFRDVFPAITETYAMASPMLIDLNMPLLLALSERMGLNTTFVRSSDLTIDKDLIGWPKLLSIITAMNAETYLSGSGEGSKRYVNIADLSERGVKVEWQKYSALSYPQLNTAEPIPNLSVIDILFNIGFEQTRELLLP